MVFDRFSCGLCMSQKRLNCWLLLFFFFLLFFSQKHCHQTIPVSFCTLYTWDIHFNVQFYTNIYSVDCAPFISWQNGSHCYCCCCLSGALPPSKYSRFFVIENGNAKRCPWGISSILLARWIIHLMLCVCVEVANNFEVCCAWNVEHLEQISSMGKDLGVRNCAFVSV